ncbi:MAG: ATP synthase F1 subunit epsilon [Dongiaceae bacterium]
MAETLHFDLVAPDKRLFSADVEMAVVPGSEGDMGILPGHAFLVANLRPGVLYVHDKDTVIKRIYVGGGFVEVGPQGCTVLADVAFDLGEVSRGDIEQQLAVLEQTLTTSNEAQYQQIEARIAQKKALLASMS